MLILMVLQSIQKSLYLGTFPSIYMRRLERRRIFISLNWFVIRIYQIIHFTNIPHLTSKESSWSPCEKRFSARRTKSRRRSLKWINRYNRWKNLKQKIIRIHKKSIVHSRQTLEPWWKLNSVAETVTISFLSFVCILFKIICIFHLHALQRSLLRQLKPLFILEACLYVRYIYHIW